ncbi:MAG: insulinase family protein [Paludibacterium sp.]|uniref:M16 family metallopeptidase n=1 Tax=Paludibacterium sp. TaxID=1917523 RepID=UPI0025E00815|nr:M16 family metallopeptidase [Paludibacterium sp.]MBV8048236.1 insulinase family protein [Paludibacterium sp.]MBV8646795.1 insulinase family protein [Paludibacterium sp.]
MPHVHLPPGMQRVREMQNITEYRLANGLQCLLLPYSSAPTFISLCYRVGSRHENYGETGMAHLLEHMVFKGSPRLGGNLLAELEQRACDLNARTSVDSTQYHAVFADNHTLADNQTYFLSWLADTLRQQSFIAQHHLDGEKIVVRNEMEMRADQPMRALLYEVGAAMFKWHNYGNDVSGARSDIEHAELQRLKAFYLRHYRPDNATLIIAGHFDRDFLLNTIHAQFGAIKTSEPAVAPTSTVEPPQQGERQVILRGVGGDAALLAAYRAPSAIHADVAATMLVETIMAWRLRKALSGQIDDFLDTSMHFAEGGLAAFLAVLSTSADSERATGNLLSTLESAEPISRAEFQLARDVWLNDWTQRTRRPDLIGHALTDASALGDWRWHFLLHDRVLATTLADVQDVAQSLLRAPNRTLGHYIPAAQAPLAWPLAGIGLDAQLADYQCLWRPSDAGGEQPIPSQAQAEALAARGMLDNGMRYALLACSEGAAAVLTLRFGDLASLYGQHLFAHVLAQMIERADIKPSGGKCRATVMSAMQLRIEVEAKSADALFQALRRIATLLRGGTEMSPGLFERIRSRLLTPERRIQSEAMPEFGLLPYPPEHPLHPPSAARLANEAEALDFSFLRAMMHTLLGADAADIAACGDFNVDEAMQMLATSFGAWRAVRPYLPIPYTPTLSVAGYRRVSARPGYRNASMTVLLPLPLGQEDADYPALCMASRLLSTSASSRLWQRLREQDALTYGTHGSVKLRPAGYALWQSRTTFAPQNQARVERAFDEELLRAHEGGFESEELAKAQQSYTNLRWKRDWTRRQMPASDCLEAARWLAGIEGEGVLRLQDFDNLLALSLAEVNDALRRHLVPDRMARILAGDF